MTRVLIVDDQPLNVELVRDLLEAAGYEVDEAGTAEEGISRARREVPDLILMDLALPGMDGFEATRVLRGLPETKDVCIVSLTAHAMDAVGVQALRNGCDGHLVKPIDTRRFAEKIGELLQAHEERRRACG